MSKNVAVASSPPATGITRDCDLVLDTTGGNHEIGQAYNTARNLRTGVQATTTGAVGVVVSSVVVANRNGIPVPSVSSGLGNGAAIQYGIPIQSDLSLVTANPAAFSTRRGVTRIICTLSADTSEAPNNDVGMQAVIGGANLVELIPVTGGGAGKVGFGIWMLGGTGWHWAMKKAADAANTLSDSTLLTDSLGVALDVVIPQQMEIRIYDYSGGPASARNNARVDLLINSRVFLTRYWDNPVGVVTPTLPPIIAPVYPQIRNTSTGPAHIYCGDFCLIHGPNNAGTLSDA